MAGSKWPALIRPDIGVHRARLVVPPMQLLSLASGQVREVRLSHPHYSWFETLGLR